MSKVTLHGRERGPASQSLRRRKCGETVFFHVCFVALLLQEN